MKKKGAIMSNKCVRKGKQYHVVIQDSKENIDDLKSKINEICLEEHRSLNQQINYWLRKCIKEHEIERGNNV